MRRSGRRLRQNISPEGWLRLWGLTPRQAEAALLSARGLTTREVAQRMQVSEGTAKAYLARAREKLGCGRTREMMALLLREGIVDAKDLHAPRFHRRNSAPPNSASRRPLGDKRSTDG